jgi:DNA-binding MarR family transcriptional regulator
MAIAPPDDAPGIRDEPDVRLARAVRTVAIVSRVFEQVCRESGVSLPQYRLLLFLRHGPKRAGELAARAAIKRPTLTAIVAGLEKEGRLTRIADESDGRGVRIEITPKGRAALGEAESALGEVVDELCQLGDYETLLGALDNLAGIVDAETFRRIAESESPDAAKKASES